MQSEPEKLTRLISPETPITPSITKIENKTKAMQSEPEKLNLKKTQPKAKNLRSSKIIRESKRLDLLIKKRTKTNPNKRNICKKL